MKLTLVFLATFVALAQAGLPDREDDGNNIDIVLPKGREQELGLSPTESEDRYKLK